MVKANFLGFEVNKKKKFLEININKTFLIRADRKKDDTLLKFFTFLSIRQEKNSRYFKENFYQPGNNISRKNIC